MADPTRPLDPLPDARRPLRTIPTMRHAPHADDCPAVGGDGGMYRVLATVHPKWRAWCRPGVCNCGRYYPPKETA